MLLRDRFRTAFVTGAGSGLGQAFTAMLLAENVAVWGTSRRPEQLPAQAQFSPVGLELGDPASIAAAWETASAAAGGFDLVINNAGSARFGGLAATDPAQWTAQIDVLLHGPVQLSGLAWEAMRGRNRGTIVNVTSLAVEFPIPFLGAYNAAKAALAAFTASLQLEAAGTGVVIIDFRPGDFRTNFNRAMQAGGAADMDPGMARVWGKLEALLERSPPPAEAAEALRRALRRGRPGLVRAGSFFQARVAPWGNRLLPARVMRLLHNFYFQTGT